MEHRWGLKELKTACRQAVEFLSKQSIHEIAAKQRLKLLNRAVQKVLDLNNPRVRLFPQDQSRTIYRLRKHIPQDVWQEPLVRKIVSDFWHGLPHQFSINQSCLAYVVGKLIIPTDLPYHKAVFDHNLYKIHTLSVGEDNECMYADINAPDHLNNSPLMLAVKLNLLEEAMVLLDHGADPKFRAGVGEPCAMEQAIGNKQRSLLKLLVGAYHRSCYEVWEGSRVEFVSALQEMPDFTMTMEWQCTSLIPFVNKLSPSDSYCIYKSGSLVRIDLTLIGWESLKSKRGRISIIFRGDWGKVFIVNHDTQVTRELDSEMPESEVTESVQKLLKKKRVSRELQVSLMEVAQVCDSRKRPKSKLIQSHLCEKNLIHCAVEVDVEKREARNDKVLSGISSFNEYMEYTGLRTKRGSAPPLVSPRSVKHQSKNLSFSVWTCSSFPLQLRHFLPMLDLLGTASKKASCVKNIFEQFKDLMWFPIKAYIPVRLAIKLKVECTGIEIGTPDPALFKVPRNTRPSQQPKDLDPSVCEMTQSEEDMQEAEKRFLSMKTQELSPLLSSHDSNYSVSAEEEPQLLPASLIRDPSKKEIPKLSRHDIYQRVKEYIHSNGNGQKDVDIVL